MARLVISQPLYSRRFFHVLTRCPSRRWFTLDSYAADRRLGSVASCPGTSLLSSRARLELVVRSLGTSWRRSFVPNGVLTKETTIQLWMFDAAVRAAATLAFISPTVVVPALVNKLQLDLDPSHFAWIGSTELGIWGAPENVTFVDGTGVFFGGQSRCTRTKSLIRQRLSSPSAAIVYPDIQTGQGKRPRH
jgi:hypothetical protein